MRRVVLLVCVTAAVLGGAPARAGAGSIARASVSSAGTQGTGEAFNASISADGTVVAFDSFSQELVADDRNPFYDVFVRDRGAGTTARVSVGVNGADPDGDSFTNFTGAQALSSTGRYVAFSSDATNLIAGDTNDETDIFVRDRSANTTTRVSVASGGAQANGSSIDPSISADGRYVVFESDATNLVAGDTNQVRDVFLRDLVAGTTTRISLTAAGTQPDASCFSAAISADGRTVAFYSAATNLVAGDTNASADVFVRDLVAGTTTRVSRATGGAQANGHSFNPVVSGDGRLVAYESIASSLAAGDANAASDIFLTDRSTGATTLVSRGVGGAPASRDSYLPSIAPDGSAIAFQSEAGDLIHSDTNNSEDVFVFSVSSSTIRRASVTATTEGDLPSTGASVSNAGAWVAFDSDATNLVAGDTNARTDTFIAEPDTIAPGAPTITAPQQGAYSGGTVTVSGTAEPRSTVTIREGAASVASTRADTSGAWSASASFADGSHAIVATATDLAGNTSAASATRTFTVDTTPPPAPVISSPAQGSTSTVNAVTIAGTAEASARVTVSEGTTALGQTTASTTGAWSLSVTFANGSHAVTARATDAAGNQGAASAARSFIVDGPPPPPTITSPAQGSTVGVPARVSGTAQAGVTVEVSEGTTVVGTAKADAAGAWTATISVPDGSHVVVATAIDSKGRRSGPSGSRSFVVDSTAPPAPRIDAPIQSALTVGLVTIDGRAERAESVQLYEGSVRIATVPVTASGAWSVRVGFDDGVHSIVAYAIAPVTGNRSAASPVRSFEVDARAPVVAIETADPSVLLPSDVVAGTAQDERGVRAVVLQLYNRATGTRLATMDAVCPACGTRTAEPVQWTSPPLEPGVYQMVARAIDLAGNGSNQPSVTIVVL